MHMYFIAVVLPAHLDEKIVAYKNYMCERYGCRVGLKSPAHITIIPPYWMDEGLEQNLFPDVDMLAGVRTKLSAEQAESRREADRARRDQERQAQLEVRRAEALEKAELQRQRVEQQRMQNEQRRAEQQRLRTQQETRSRLPDQRSSFQSAPSQLGPRVHAPIPQRIESRIPVDRRRGRL